ncbi:MAG: universal stress protein [Deltaproteobacteria bacterium]|jgi:nucleotide-binding universal stress UspA family protein|nr:universal stress protein [Deltaproteobacteria bacterium]MBW2534040.1 universal stress protein [Deltaproteobacteria bacterium]
MIQIHRILVPVDFSDCSRAALEHAIHFGNSLGVEAVDVMHVWRPPRFVGLDTKVRVQGGKEQTLREFAQSEVGAEMKRFLAELEHGGRFKVGGRLEAGEPHRRILSIAEAEHYDLIIMGTHGVARSGRLGSLASRIVRDAPCPVLTIRVPGSGHTDPPPEAT